MHTHTHTHTHTQNRELLCTLSGNINGMAITENDLEIPLSSYPEEIKSQNLGQYLQHVHLMLTVVNHTVFLHT